MVNTLYAYSTEMPKTIGQINIASEGYKYDE
jgi:hypothetical protein